VWSPNILAEIHPSHARVHSATPTPCARPLSPMHVTPVPVRMEERVHCQRSTRISAHVLVDGLELSVPRLITVPIILAEMELNAPPWMATTSALVRGGSRENSVTSTSMSVTTVLANMEPVRIPMVDTNVTASLAGPGRTATVSTILVIQHLVSMVENVTERGDTNTLALVRMDSTEPTVKTISTIAEEICVKMAENAVMESTPTPAIVLPTGQGNIVSKMWMNAPSVAPVRTMEPAATPREATNASASMASLAETVKSIRMTAPSTPA